MVNGGQGLLLVVARGNRRVGRQRQGGDAGEQQDELGLSLGSGLLEQRRDLVAGGVYGHGELTRNLLDGRAGHERACDTGLSRGQVEEAGEQFRKAMAQVDSSVKVTVMKPGETQVIQT